MRWQIQVASSIKVFDLLLLFVLKKDHGQNLINRSQTHSFILCGNSCWPNSISTSLDLLSSHIHLVFLLLDPRYSSYNPGDVLRNLSQPQLGFLMIFTKVLVLLYLPIIYVDPNPYIYTQNAVILASSQRNLSTHFVGWLHLKGSTHQNQSTGSKFQPLHSTKEAGPNTINNKRYTCI